MSHYENEERDDSREYVRESDLKSPILFENAQWRVAAEGMEEKETDGGPGVYFIEASRLEELDWIRQLSEKTWCDPRLFVEAYYTALDLLLNKKFELDTVAFIEIRPVKVPVNQRERPESGMHISNGPPDLDWGKKEHYDEELYALCLVNHAHLAGVEYFLPRHRR